MIHAVANLMGEVMRLRRAAFTLIELLAVVAIIALLVSLLLPALGAAREHGRRAKCLSNLHQIALAFNAYADDNRGRFFRNIGNVHLFYGGKIDSYSTFRYPAPTHRPLNPYVAAERELDRSVKTFLCPSDRGYLSNYPETATMRTYDYFGNSYMMNAALVPPVRQRPTDAMPPPIHISSITVPASLFILTGDQPWYWAYSTAPHIRWHDTAGTTMNFGFLDGHAARIRLEEGLSQTGQYSFPRQWLPPEDEPTTQPAGG